MANAYDPLPRREGGEREREGVEPTAHRRWAYGFEDREGHRAPSTPAGKWG